MEEIKLLKLILRALNRLNANYQQDISLASDFEPSRPFMLYVGISGVVVGLDQNGKSVNRTFTEGYHPIIFKKITSAGTTATSLAALYFE